MRVRNHVAGSFVNFAVVHLDADGQVVFWDDAARRMFGYLSREVLGVHVSQFFPEEDRIARVPEMELTAAAQSGWIECDGWLVRKGGVRFRSSGAVASMPPELGGLVSFIRIVSDQTAAHATQKALHDARDRMRFALSAARMGTWRWDMPEDVHARDENLNRMLGLAGDHPSLTLDGFLAIVHPDDRKAVACAIEVSSKGRRLDIEYRILRPDGEVRWMHAQGDVFGQWGRDPTYMAGACVDITDRKIAELELERIRGELERRVLSRTADLERAVQALKLEAKRRRAAQLARKKLLARIVSTQEQERRRIARELHDSVGQYTTAINLGLQAIRGQIAENDPARESAEKLLTLVGELGQEVHRIALELRPRSLDDVSLQSALQQHLENWSSHANIPCQFHSQGLEGFQPPMEVASNVFRVVQEALVNVARHSEASRVSVVIERQDSRLSVIIEDDGKGFDSDRRVGVRGGTKRLGLLGMRERASLVKGELEIESRPGCGTTVFLRVPLPSATANEIPPSNHVIERPTGETPAREHPEDTRGNAHHDGRTPDPKDTVDSAR